MLSIETETFHIYFQTGQKEMKDQLLFCYVHRNAIFVGS